MKRINSIYISILLVLQIFNSFLCFGMYNNIKYTHEDAVWSIIVMALLGLISLFFFFKIANFEEDKNIFRKNKILYGKYLGIVINIILIMLFFLLGTMFLYNISDFISSQYLDKTPSKIISILLIVVCFINVSKGFGTIAKSGMILFFVSILLFFISALSLISYIDLSNFYPILKDGLNNPIREGTILFMNNILPIYLFLIVPKCYIKDKEHYKRNIIIAYLFSILIIFLTVFITLGVFGIYLASLFQYPEYMVLKNITLFTSIERIENLLSMQWVIYAFVALSLIIYYISSFVKENSNYVSLIVSFLIWFFSSFLFKNNAMMNSFTHNFSPYIFSVFLIIYLTSLILIVIKRKNVI